MGRSERSAAWARACAFLCSALLVLAACGGPPAEPMVTVHGRVEAVLGLPLAGIVVRSQGRTTTTGADGAFALAGLTAPYTALLSFAAPAVSPIPEILGEGFDAFGLTLAALGRGSVAVRLHLLEASLAAEGEPLAYHGYAAASATLVPPGGGQQVLVQLGIEFGPHASPTLYPRSILQPGEPVAGTVSVPLPLVGSGFRLVGGAQVGGGLGQDWSVGDEPVLGTLALPAPPQVLLPADGVAGVTAAMPFSAAHATDGPVTFA